MSVLKPYIQGSAVLAFACLISACDRQDPTILAQMQKDAAEKASVQLKLKDAENKLTEATEKVRDLTARLKEAESAPKPAPVAAPATLPFDKEKLEYSLFKQMTYLKSEVESKMPGTSVEGFAIRDFQPKDFDYPLLAKIQLTIVKEGMRSEVLYEARGNLKGEWKMNMSSIEDTVKPVATTPPPASVPSIPSMPSVAVAPPPAFEPPPAPAAPPPTPAAPERPGVSTPVMDVQATYIFDPATGQWKTAR